MSEFVAVAAVGILLLVTIVWWMYHVPVTPRSDKQSVIYAARCGGYIDGFTATAPFVTLSLLPDAIEIVFRGKAIVVPYADVRSVGVQRHIVMKGVRISVRNYNEDIFLFCRDNDRTASLIKHACAEAVDSSTVV